MHLCVHVPSTAPAPGIESAILAKTAVRRGDDTVGNPHRAQISQIELFELILLLKLDKQFPVVQFEATVPSPPLTVAARAACRRPRSPRSSQHLALSRTARWHVHGCVGKAVSPRRRAATQSSRGDWREQQHTRFMMASNACQWALSLCRPPPPGWHSWVLAAATALTRKGTSGVSTNGVTAKFMFFDGDFLGTPIKQLLYSKKCQGVPFSLNCQK